MLDPESIYELDETVAALVPLAQESGIVVGELVSCSAMVTFVGRTSIEVGVKVSAENPITGETTHTNSAYLVFVALGEDDRPREVPGLVLESDDDRRRFEAGKARQSHRLLQRNKKRAGP